MVRVLPAILGSLVVATASFACVAAEGVGRFAGVGAGIDLSAPTGSTLTRSGDAAEAGLALGTLAGLPPRQSPTPGRPMKLSIDAAAAPVPKLLDGGRPAAGRLGVAASGRPSAYVSARDNGGVVGLTYKIKPPAAPAESAD